MQNIVKIILLSSLLFIQAHSESSSTATCNEDDSGFWASFQPPFIPVQITIDTGGRIEVSASGEIITYAGKFGLGYSKDFSSSDNYCYHIIINNISTKEKTVYAIQKGEELDYRTIKGDGIHHLKSNTNRLEIDITNDDEFEINITESDINIKKIRLGIENNALKMKKGDKEVVLKNLDMHNYAVDKIKDIYNPLSTFENIKDGVRKVKELVNFFSED